MDGVRAGHGVGAEDEADDDEEKRRGESKTSYYTKQRVN
jgi:hypothetical protein